MDLLQLRLLEKEVAVSLVFLPLSLGTQVHRAATIERLDLRRVLEVKINITNRRRCYR